MKNVQPLTFDQIITFSQEHNKTNFSNLEQYHCVTGKTIADFVASYIDNTALSLNFDDDQLIEIIDKWADKNTPTSYNELLLWFSRDSDVVDDYIKYFGFCSNMNIIEVIQAAYCWTLGQAMIVALQTIRKEIIA